MTSYELHDKILRELPKDGRPTNPGSYNDTDLYYLNSCGYIDVKEQAGGGIFLMSITPIGLKFISEGGFTEEYKQKLNRERDEHLQRENWIATTKAARNARTIAIWSVIIALGSLIVAAIALIRGQVA